MEKIVEMSSVKSFLCQFVTIKSEIFEMLHVALASLQLSCCSLGVMSLSSALSPGV